MHGKLHVYRTLFFYWSKGLKLFNCHLPPVSFEYEEEVMKHWFFITYVIRSHPNCLKKIK